MSSEVVACVPRPKKLGEEITGNNRDSFETKRNWLKS
jgi:hypothetical protein